MDSTDAPWYFHPFLVAFGALLPMTVIGWSATTVANHIGERRARRLLRPRPRVTYWLLGLGSALVGGAFALLAWAAGANPTGEDWIATGLVWATMTSVCATLMMAGRALTAGTAKGPAWLIRLKDAQRAKSAVAPAATAAATIAPDVSAAVSDASATASDASATAITAAASDAILPYLSRYKHQDQISAEDLTGNSRSNPQHYRFPRGRTPRTVRVASASRIG